MSLHAHLSATLHDGIRAEHNGATCQLAIIGADGQIIDAGDAVNRAITKLIAEAWRNTMIGQGHLRVLAKPEPSKPGRLAA
ncbi:hypothetical protein ACTSKR_07535 [Chitinibacteraceae bacterium HSL-7]